MNFALLISSVANFDLHLKNNHEPPIMKSIKSILYFNSAAFILLVFAGCQKTNTFVLTPPVAVAGNSQTVQLPDDSVTLSGTGKPTKSTIVGYLWSEVSGPNVPVIASESSPATVVRGLITGTYLFQFMVVDSSGLTGVDTVSIKVMPSNIDSLVLQPTNNPSEMNLILWNGADASGPSIELPVEAWTNLGTPFNIRGLIKFDLSTIQSSATIISANLYLFSDSVPANGNLINANFGTSNGLFLQQVANDWSPASTTWFNQPSTVSNTQISIPTTNSSTLDLNVDVTNIVSSQLSNKANYGFLLRLQNEVTYNSRIFCSSEYSVASRHPKLVVYYQFR
jgi:hypothetical protein